MTNRATPDAATQIEIYRRMALIKANDERSRKVIMNGRLVMPYYSPRGQEVIPSAISVNLTDQDYICTIYRGSHDQLAKGLPLKDLWAEVAGRTTGTEEPIERRQRIGRDRRPSRSPEAEPHDGKR